MASFIWFIVTVNQLYTNPVFNPCITAESDTEKQWWVPFVEKQRWKCCFSEHSLHWYCFSNRSLHWCCFSKRVIIAKRSKNPLIKLKLNCRVASTSRFWVALYKQQAALSSLDMQGFKLGWVFAHNFRLWRKRCRWSRRYPCVRNRAQPDNRIAVTKNKPSLNNAACCIVYCLRVSRCRRFCRAKTIGSGLCSREVFRKFDASFKVD